MVGRGRYRFHLWAVVVSGLAVCLMLPEPLANRGAAIRPHLRGQQAVDTLKKQGAYESLAKALEVARYQVENASEGSGYRARNRAQGLEVEFAPEGIRLKHPEGALEMRLAGYGYGERWKKPSAAPVTVQGNRVEYDRGALKEWYLNEARGLEQGFTLERRPGRVRAGEPLVLVLETGGDLRPEAETGGDALRLRAGPQTVLRYSGLKTWDARGRELPSRLEVVGRQVRIVVEDAAAEYPLTVDPVFTQQAKLTASDGAAEDRFGYSVALSGDTALVGAVGDYYLQGSAYVFVRSGATWIEQQRLTAPDGAVLDMFGSSVALSGDTALVGAVGYDGHQGSAYVFVRSGATWSQQAKLTASDGAAGDWLGHSVALSGDTALVGAHEDDIGSNPSQGSAYVFVRSGGTWSQQQKLVASDGAASDYFGSSVALSGDTALVGALRDDGWKGSAYVFVRSGATWSEQQKLTALDGAAEDWFGGSVALSGDTALVGAPHDDSYKGSAYVFVRSSATWSQQAKLTASDGAAGDNFGISVALSGDAALVGAFLDDFGADLEQGSAYVFVRSGATWSHQAKLAASDGAVAHWFGHSVALSGDTALVGAPIDDSSKGSAYVFPLAWGEQAKLTASDGASGDSLGKSVALSGDTALVGAAFDDIGSNTDQGSAYVFVRSGGAWTYQAKLTAFDGATADYFGFTVALSGDTALVGALGDDNGKGSAYVFVRSGTTWTPQAKLTASDGGVGDWFGHSVALSGDTALVGAPIDDSSKGSAYVFVRSGATWSQQQKLTASDGAAGDCFGTRVALSGDTALVGADSDDVDGKLNQGSVYVFVRSGTTWGQQAKLTALDGAAADKFGWPVALSEDTALVGARYDDVGANPDQGSAYVFVRSGATWSQQAKLTASDGAASDLFGYSVALSGDRALVGAWWDDIGSNPDQGSAYVFVRSGSSWSEQQKLTASDGAAGDWFGSSVALRGNTGLVGATERDSTRGAIYVFTGPCMFTLTPPSPVSVPASGASGQTVTISTDSGCGWTAEANAAWIGITGGPSGTGSGTVTYVVAANPSSLPRSGTMSIAGQTYTVNQAGVACTYGINPSSASVGAGGGSGSVSVTASASDCAWTATSNAAWVTITSGASGTGNGAVNYSVAVNPGAARSATITVMGLTFTLNQAGTGAAVPTVGGVSPASGAGASQTFTFTFSDANGWHDLGVVNVLINFWLDGRNSCYFAYSRPYGVLYLVNDPGTALLPELVLGSGGSTSNSQCTIYGTGSSASGSGNTLTLTLSISFHAGYSGTKIIYLAARDVAENNSGWQRMGAWTVPGAPATSPAVVSMNPVRGSGSSQTFTFQFSDTDGYADLGVLNILVNDWLDGRNACYIAYSRTYGVLYLVNDAGTALLPELVLGSGGSVSNSQCTIFGAGSSASGIGTTLTLTLNMSFKPAFAGNRAFYLAARDAAEHNSGWQALGTWTVP